MGHKYGLALLPQNCFLCTSPSGAAPLCAPCRAALPRLTAHCPICAQPLAEARLCGACLAHAPHFDATWALFRYEFPLDRLIQAFKFKQRLALGAWFADEMAAQPIPTADMVMPLPLSAARLRERGFNQSVELARRIASKHHVPLLLDACTRRHQAVAQSRLPWRARQKNIRHAFECHMNLSGKHILVIDDVMTTGATLNELARTLKAHGAAQVSNLVVARVARQ